MEKLVFPFFILASSLFLFTQKAEKGPIEPSSFAEKMAPSDFFLAARSWPERNFPLKGYLRAIETALEQQKAAAELLGPCDARPRWRLEGPSNFAGRVNVMAKHPTDDQTYLVGFASGGIWRTTNNGQTWQAVFDQFPHLAIGDLQWSQSDLNTVWAATGDPNITSYPSPGNGIFKSSDGGQTWVPAGLQGMGIVSKIRPNPFNINELWAAVMGNPFRRDSLRGVYRTTDGGATWQRKLFLSTQAGASDLLFDQLNPQTLYAAGWDRIRSNTESLLHGPNTKIFKTTDGGTTWAALTDGLPTQRTGRIGLAMSATNPKKIYAVFADTASRFLGIFKSTNSGVNFSAMPGQGVLSNIYADFGWYFCKIRVNPANDDEVWPLGLQAWRSSGQSFVQHVSTHNDVHDVLFQSNGKWIIGTDGGPFETAPWMIGPAPGSPLISMRMNGLPTLQAYRAAFNPHQNGLIRTGAQDNGTTQGTVSTINQWAEVGGADGFQPVYHPTDPKKQFFEMQNGQIWATADGTSYQSVGPALGTTDRVAWDMPYLMNSSGAKLFAGTYRLYESNGTGPTLAWSPISPDLTKGVIYGPRFHVISTMDESKIEANKLLIGTSDGNMWRREASNFFAIVSQNGLPNRYISAAKWSPAQPNRFFVALSGYRNDEQLPHLFRTDNSGELFFNISGDLPPVAINDLLVLPNSQDQKLIVATDAGVYFSKNAGQNWQLGGAAMPSVPVYDLDFHVAQNRVLAATFGRSIYTMHVDSMFAQSEATASVAGKILPLVGATQSVVPQNVAVNGQNASPLGDFSVLATKCEPFEIRPSKNDNLTEGVTSFDLVLIAKHILGSEPFNKPEKWVAADVNRTGTVSTADIVDLRKVILGILTAFPNGNPSWRFFEKNYSFPSQNPVGGPLPEVVTINPAFLPSSPVEFKSVKVGDINNSLAGFAGEVESRSRWPIFAENRWFEKGETVEIELSADLFEKAAWQFSAAFAIEKLRLEKAEPLLNELFLNEKMIEKGQFSALWTNPKSEKLGLQKMLRLRFLALEAGRFSEAFWLKNEPTSGAVFSTQGIENEPVMQFLPAPKGAEKGVSKTVVLTAAPNPVGENGTTVFSKKWAGKTARAELFDGSGRLIFSTEKAAFDRDGSWPLPADRFPKSGFFVLVFRTGDETAAIKILKK